MGDPCKTGVHRKMATKCSVAIKSQESLVLESAFIERRVVIFCQSLKRVCHYVVAVSMCSVLTPADDATIEV